MTAVDVAHWTHEPFVMGTPDQFADLRALFERLRFTEQDICAAASIGTMYELPSFEARTDRLADPSDPQALLVQLLVDGQPVPWRIVRSTLGAADVATMEDLGLLRPSRLDEDLCTASVALYPTQGVYLVSDKHSNMESVAIAIPADIVYSAMTPETHRFTDLMPRVSCSDYLELCSGSGIAALAAGRNFARRATAIDITERSTRFARFSIALNGLQNVEAVAGDLYEPVAGHTFDVIVAHPPYVPAFETRMVYRDGGEDGEQITLRIVAGLADHLRPGGQFYCDCMMTDRVGAPLETRIREMLGSAEGEFDIILGQAGTLEVEEFVSRANDPDTRERRREMLERLGVERFVNAAFLIHRRTAPRPVVTRRRLVSSATTDAHYQWYLRWATATAEWARPPLRLLESRPRRAPDVELRSRSMCGADGWTVVESSLVTRTPFALEATCPSWFPMLVARCDGTVTAREHLRYFRDIGVISDTASDGEFAVLIGQLADGGFVELEDFPFSVA